jgi:hypothetical protein
MTEGNHGLKNICNFQCKNVILKRMGMNYWILYIPQDFFLVFA